MTDLAIGVDVGGTKALALIVAHDGRVLAWIHRESAGLKG